MPGFWSSETLIRELETLIHPYDPQRVRHCAYELALGSEAYVTGMPSEFNDDRLRTRLEGDRVVVPPGQFALLLTEERVEVPEYALGLISIRSGPKLRGLVNVSGFHVDPGYSGQLVFAVFNAASSEIFISKGENIFLIWYCYLDSPTALKYDGEHQGRDKIFDAEIMNLQGSTYSPTALATRVSLLEEWKEARSRWRDRWQNWGMSILGGAIVVVISVGLSILLSTWIQ